MQPLSRYNPLTKSKQDRTIFNVVSKRATKVGGDFHPMLKGILQQLETMHSEGKLGDVVHKTEQTYTKEYAAYTAKSAHTNAADSQNNVRVLACFRDMLKKEKENIDTAVQTQMETVLVLKYKM